jgi:hypothetical protein
MIRTGPAIHLETATDWLVLDASSARLTSWRSKAAPNQQFCAGGSADPVFVLQYLDGHRRYRQITSLQAGEVVVRAEPAATGPDGTARAVVATYSRLAGLDLDVTISVRASAADGSSEAFGGATRWSLSLHNGAGLLITAVQFPFVVLRYHLDGSPGSEALLWPYGPGVLLRAPQPQDLAPDDPHTWQMRPENGDTWHYPGYTVAQLMAYYNDRAGVYLGCDDAKGRLKLIRPVHHDPGIRLGLAHVGDWPTDGARALEYDVVLGTFQGDWMDAADIYRSWSLQQAWAKLPLHARQDVPGWLLDSPPHIVVRIQGELDIGPAGPNEAFLPYPKIIPYLDTLADRLGVPVLPVIMSWERPGPWIYPDCFPPSGGEESLREFCDMARQRGWHVGTFCNGTRWVVGHYWSHYDGQDYFHAQGGARSVCLTHDGQPWPENWDATWRPSYACCVGASRTREIAADFVRTCIDLGLDWIQFFDQNVGCAPFPCFSPEHGHAGQPGSWMTEEMGTLLTELHTLMDEANRAAGGERPIVLSVEGPANEFTLPAFQICDIRVVPPGHSAGGLPFVPLYHYLYHEFILIQGGFGTGPEPYHMPIRSAYNLVVGEIPGAVLVGDGRLLNADTWNWAPWEPPIGDDEASVQMLKSAAALRRGPAREHLVFGRMMHPAQVEGIPTMRWQYGGRDHQIPAVFHSAWRAPDGRPGIVLANWTTDAQQVRVRDPRLSAQGQQYVSTPSGIRNVQIGNATNGLVVDLPALGCALLI